MTLEDQIKKEEEELKQLEEAENNEEQEESEEEEAAEADAEEEEQAEEGQEEEDEDEGAQEEDGTKEGEEDDQKDEEEEVKNNNDLAAKLRIERKQRMKLQEQIEEMRKAQEAALNQAKPKEEAQPEAPEETIEERVNRLEREKYQQNLQRQAVEEFNSIEAEFSKETPDYEEASAHVIKNMYSGVKSVYPELNDQQAVSFVQKQVLQIASNAAQRGLNPAEVLYQMAYDKYGFQANAPQPQPSNKVNNLKTIAKNKKRSASPLAGGGRSASSNVSLQEAGNMDLAAFGRMSEAEIDQLIEQA